MENNKKDEVLVPPSTEPLPPTTTEPGPHPSIGINARRGCTDCWCLIIGFLMWILLLVIAITAFTRGNLDRLVYGTDYMGNICSKEISTPIANMSDSEWSTRKYLWYPFTFNPREGELVLRDALKLGVCVATCPPADTVLTAYQNGSTSEPPISYPVFYNSRPNFYRCVPNFLSFKCANISSCASSVASSASNIGAVDSAVRFGTSAYREMVQLWWVFAAGAGIAIGISFLWVFLLRFTVKPIVVLIIIIVIFSLIGAGVLAFLQRRSILKKSEETGVEDSTAPKIWLGVAIALWIGALIVICVVLFLGKTIMIACDVIEEAARVPIAIPTMNLVPPVFVLILIPITIFAIFIAVFIQACGKTLDLQFETPVFNSSLDLSNIEDLIKNNDSTTNIDMKSRQYVFESWRIYAQFYNLFMYLWCCGLLGGICYMTFALCGVFWYWSMPGDKKSPPIGSVCIALKTVLRHHLGTVAFGAFLVAVVQLFRAILVFIEQKAKGSGASSDKRVVFLFKSLHCCLACIERVIKFCNRNAFVVCSMNGKSFFPAAFEGLELLAGNFLSASATHTIATAFLFFGKIQITLLTAVIGYVLVDRSGKSSSVSHGVIIVLVVAIIAYIIASIFLNVLSACIDTILLCFCYDVKHSDIDYFPADLAKHIDRTSEAGLMKKKTTEMQETNGINRKPSLPVLTREDL